MQLLPAPRDETSHAEPAGSDASAGRAARGTGVTGTWHGRWGGRAIRLRLVQFDSLVVGDLSIEGVNLRISGGVDALGALGWSSHPQADPGVSYRTGSSGWRLEPHPRVPALCGGLQRHRTHPVALPDRNEGSVVQFEARLTLDGPRLA